MPACLGFYHNEANCILHMCAYTHTHTHMYTQQFVTVDVTMEVAPALTPAHVILVGWVTHA